MLHRNGKNAISFGNPKCIFDNHYCKNFVTEEKLSLLRNSFRPVLR